MREHVETLMEIARRKKSKHCIDENGDIDFPIIKTHIHIKEMVHMEPEHQKDSMVHILSHEGATTGFPINSEEIPQESSFIAKHRDNVPAPRRILVNTSGRALGRGARGGAGARGARGGAGAKGTRGARSAS